MRHAKRQYRTFKVLATALLSEVAGRKKLAGLHRFLSEGYDWDIELIRTESEVTYERLEAAARNGVDGFFAAIPETQELHRLHASLNIPTVFTDFPNERTMSEFKRCVFVMDDVRDICRSAANAILSSGLYKSYLYAENAAGSRWSRERGNAFSAEMAKRGVRVVRMPSECVADPESLSAAILGCEKPAAIFAAYDDTARTVLSACRRTGLKIPADVAILGIGNDEDICMHTVPRLSSVQPNFEEEGYRAARELQSMMLFKGNPPRRRFFCGGSTVLERGTTHHTANAGMLAHDAMSFISRNALKGISARDVAQHLHVSRRLADLRFRDATGTSMQKAIIESRLGEVCRLLADTSLAISDVAVRCGYPDANYLKILFRRRFGMSMREWRKKIISPPSSRSLAH
ncbi:MAG: substrate-binding domain-containing protein [Kiritimatiellae bacterium]|nr:substrate-binding domain-containing protein [Kiritimatiellia bacterium]